MALSKIQDEMLALSGNACKAWVNFNGTGTVAINDSFNVSSITDIGTGAYEINFINDMLNTTYACFGGGNPYHAICPPAGGAKTVSKVQINTYNQAQAITDYASITVSVVAN